MALRGKQIEERGTMAREDDYSPEAEAAAVAAYAESVKNVGPVHPPNSEAQEIHDA